MAKPASQAHSCSSLLPQSAFHFHVDFKADEEVLSGLYIEIQKMCSDGTISTTTIEMDKYNNEKGVIFLSKMCKDTRTELLPGPNRFWTLVEIDLESKWLNESTDPIFTEEDHEWVDQADREAEAMAMVEKDRARSGTGIADVDHCGTSLAEIMATQSSRTYLTRLCRRQTEYSEAEFELEPEP